MPNCFQLPAATPDTLFDLPLFAACGETMEILTFSGAETVKFLQGQVTCDVNEVAAGMLRSGAHCNPKGRAQATFLAFADHPDEDGNVTRIHLLLPAGMAEPTATQLKKFAIFSRVEVSTLPAGQMQVMLLGGQTAPQWLAQQGLSIPPWPQIAAAGTARIAALDAERPLYLLLTDTATHKQWLENLPAGTPVAGQNGWWQCMVALGHCHILPATQEAFIPQELNYDATQGISFRKGCYKGQEIIARLHFKGTPKSRAASFVQRAGKPLQVGDSLHDEAGNRIGDVVTVAEANDGRWLLAVVKTAEAERQAHFDAEGQPVALERVALPYVLP